MFFVCDAPGVLGAVHTFDFRRFFYLYARRDVIDGCLQTTVLFRV